MVHWNRTDGHKRSLNPIDKYFLEITANTEAQVNAQGKEVTDKNGVQRIEIDKLVTKIRVGDGNIKLKSPPSHTLAGKRSPLYHTIFNFVLKSKTQGFLVEMVPTTLPPINTLSILPPSPGCTCPKANINKLTRSNGSLPPRPLLLFLLPKFHSTSSLQRTRRPRSSTRTPAWSWTSPVQLSRTQRRQWAEPWQPERWAC